LHSRVLMYHVFHPFIVKLILIEDFFVSWIHGIVHDHVLRVLSHTSEWKTTLKIVPRFDTNPTPLWWKSRTVKGAPLFQSWTLLILVLLIFFQILIFWWFCYRLISLLVMNPKLFTKVFMKLKIHWSSHGLQLFTLDTIVGCVV
jgi:hypothetical protein